MISETFVKGFEAVMKTMCQIGTPISDSEVCYMCGLIKGAHLCYHMNVDDVDNIKYAFEVINQSESDYLVYVKVVKDLMTKQHED